MNRSKSRVIGGVCQSLPELYCTKEMQEQEVNLRPWFKRGTN